jgi:RHS repeat-associated protein
MTIGRQQDGQSDYTWTWTDGRKLHFNVAGKLDRITVPTGEAVRLLYDSQNVLVRVIDPQGRSLNLVYYDRHLPNQFHGVQFIDTPVGRFAYEYGSAAPKGTGLLDQRQLLANLVRVRLPDHFDPDTKAHALSSRGATRSTTSRIYHHEDPRSPWLMTGISIESVGEGNKLVTTRYATYGYDDTGRAILSTHAGNVDKVTLDNHEAGKTVLTNSLGQKTVYRYNVIAGEFRLFEVRGAGCALCGEPNVRYGYDGTGRLTETTKLSENGEPVAGTRVERDKNGRVTLVSKVVYQGRKPKPAQLQVRFEYQGSLFAPALVARPSVVPGKELVMRIDYNKAGQPLSVTETGWAPTVDGKHAAERIERTLRYFYASINGRSLLSKIDGPLPNGKTNTPLDSDITIIEYDHQRSTAATPKGSPVNGGLANYASWERHEGILTAIITPGNRKNQVDYDYAGRIAAVKDTDGHSSTLRYSPRGQLLAVSRDGITHSTSYDAFGHLIELGYIDGTHYHALSRLGYDDAGRNIWSASTLGILQTMRFDTENQLLERTTLSNAIKQTQHYKYDHLGRLQSESDANRGTLRIGRNVLGLPNALTDATGRTTRFAYDAAGNVTSRMDVANAQTHFDVDIYGHPTTVVAPNGAATRYVRDDFGHILATIGADSGTTIRRFDAADRLVASIDANGNRASYEYNAMGCIVKQSVIDARNDGKQTVTVWRYEGARLIAIEHPNQTERYNYDAQGRLSARTIILGLASGIHVRYTSRYRYNAMGQLSGVILPDGSDVNYRRNGQNQVTALERNPVSSPWLRWLIPRQTIVQGLERDVVGLKRLTYGNGIEAQYQRSKEGNLARIVYRYPRTSALIFKPEVALEALLGVRPALAASKGALPGALDLPSDPQALLDHRYLWNLQGNLLHTRDMDATSSYAYDARDRLIAVATGPIASFARYHYDDNGNRLLTQEGLDNQSNIHSNTVKTSYAPSADHWKTTAVNGGTENADHDAIGQPRRIGQRSFVWDAFGKLLEVREGQRVLARYRYNHQGERIEKTVEGKHTYYLYEDRRLVAELDAKGMLQRQYVYLADLPIAVVDTRCEDEAYNAGDTALTRIAADLAAVWRSWFGKVETIVYLHNNHLGATELATDAKGKPVWQAKYSPFGKLMPAVALNQPTFELNLRLPGQYADKETGLYYNDHRYYDPARGRYLTPDPLGLRGGWNSYAYVNDNPLKYIDPRGLVLFAFDGSGNDRHDPAQFSNVVNFLNLYQDEKFYITGVGTKDEETGISPITGDLSGQLDIANAYTGKRRIAAMIDRLNRYSEAFADNETAFNIDIVGFSRGAAEARDFANHIEANLKDGYYYYTDKSGKTQCQKVALNFMGLFDTVLSTHLGDYQLRVPDAFKFVAQAMALNEYRGGTVAFPMESIRGAPTPQNATRIERGFLGAHSDIGGGYLDGDLAKVALVWMVDQAHLANLKIGEPQRNIIANPVLHDKSSNLIRGADAGGPTTTSEDRDVRYLNGSVEKQRKTTLGVMSYTDTLQFIKYNPNPNTRDEIAGSVDMKSYLQWLNDHGYDIHMTVH